MPTTTSPPPQRGQVATQPVVAPAKARLGWLDALRGLAALTVMLSHFIQFMLPGVFTAVSGWFIPGSFGVLLFFMVSGYIVPASLERRGSVRTFWLSRLFRIYPMALFSIALGLTFVALGWQTRSLGAITPWLTLHPLTTALANATLLQDLLGGANLLPVMWTLSYEMVFYCLVASLFTMGLHRRSGEIAAGFAALSLVFLMAVPPLCFASSYQGAHTAVLASVCVAVVGIYCMVSRRIPGLVGAVLIGGLALVLVLADGRLAPWYSMVILATMFSGTALYRAEQGQAGRRRTAALCILVAAVSLAAGAFHGGDRGSPAQHSIGWPWLLTVAAVWVLFTSGMLLRNRRIPGALAWLGRISYSVYMLHVVLLSAVLWLMEQLHVTVAALPLGAKLLWLLVPCGAVLGLSQLTYTFVEMPFQRLGRKAIRAADLRWGSMDRAPRS
jgi:peptidoglycan/LPS O-acetylase OafA/YrhL